MEKMALRYLRKGWQELTDHEKLVVYRMAERVHVSRNTNKEFESGLTMGQRLADQVAAFGGSWPFILLFSGFFFCWLLLNSLVLKQAHESFDPYPYILLNLILPALAAIQAPVIMMSQNRHEAKDRLDAAHDYEVNLKAEIEIREVCERLEELVRLNGEQKDALARLLAARPARDDDRPPSA